MINERIRELRLMNNDGWIDFDCFIVMNDYEKDI